METKFIYDLILPYFIGKDDLRPALNYVHNGGNGYVYAAECKECKGTGKVNLRIKEFSLSESRDSYGIKTGLHAYKANLLQTIAVAAQMLQAEQITCRYREGSEAAVFSFAGIDILLMPYLSEDASMEIKLNNV
ncbi:MAG: hypothetical protein LBD80_09295 [Tannerella sp.]|jgi:hypothetical protein|nr:hypothetical protein [Tannerella sp.]